jgi:bile acid:Na+ symporter, BASS family
MPVGWHAGRCRNEERMNRSLDQLYQVALVLTLWITGLGLGMAFGPGQILRTLRRGRLFARAAVLDVVILPLLVWGLVQMFSVPDHYATGLLLVGVASAGPLGIKAAQLAGADLPYAIALVVVLEATNAVAIPVWVALLLPPGVQVPMWPVARTLLLLVLAPLAVGMAVRARRPLTAVRLAQWAAPLSTVGLLVVIAVVVARHAGIVVDAFAAVGAAVLLALLLALLLGWLLGGPARPTRAATSLVTGVRANGLALAIAQASFPALAAVSVAIVAFGIFSILPPSCSPSWSAARHSPTRLRHRSEGALMASLRVSAAARFGAIPAAFPGRR